MSSIAFGVKLDSASSDSLLPQTKKVDPTIQSVNEFAKLNLGKENDVPKPDFSAFAQKVQPMEEDSKSNSPLRELSPNKTPTRSGPFQFSPSIKESPAVPSSTHPYHKVSPLFKVVGNGHIRDFQGKPIHTLILENPEMDGILIDRQVAGYISKWSRHLSLKKEGEPNPLTTGAFVITVIAPDMIQIQDVVAKMTRVYGIHRQKNSDKKRLFPLSGDGLMVFKGQPSPADLLAIVKSYRANPSGKRPIEFLQEALNK